MRVTRTIALIVAGVVAVATLPGTAGEPIPSAASILDDIKAVGARTVFGRLSSHEAQFDAVCDAIEGAEPKWLEVAAHLRPVSDGAAALSLNFSVARALPRAPTRVLALVGHGFALEDICTSPYIEPDPGVAEDYQTRALAALATVSDSRLKALVQQCATRVRIPKG